MTGINSQIESRLKQELLSRGVLKIQVREYPRLYATLNAKNELRYKLIYSVNGHSTTKTYKGSTLKQIISEYFRDTAIVDDKDDPNRLRKDIQKEVQKRKATENQLNAPTVKVFEEWSREVTTSGDWKYFKPREKMRRINQMEKHFINKLGNKPIGEITPPDLLEIFKPLYQDGFSTADKVYKNARKFFSEYAFKTNYSFQSPFTDELNSNLKKAKELGKSRAKNYKAPHYSAIPYLFETLYDDYLNESDSARVITFQLLTGMRAQAVRNLKWDHIHYDDEIPEGASFPYERGFIEIPIENNKVKTAKPEDRRVYFGRLTYELLHNVEEIQTNLMIMSDYVFPKGQVLIEKRYKADPTIALGTQLSSPLGDNAINQFFKRTFLYLEMKRGHYWKDEKVDDFIQPHATARACFETWARESYDENGQPRYTQEVIDKSLTHKTVDRYNGAYNRAKNNTAPLYQIKQDWEDFLITFWLIENWDDSVLPIIKKSCYAHLIDIEPEQYEEIYGGSKTALANSGRREVQRILELNYQKYDGDNKLKKLESLVQKTHSKETNKKYRDKVKRRKL